MFSIFRFDKEKREEAGFFLNVKIIVIFCLSYTYYIYIANILFISHIGILRFYFGFDQYDTKKKKKKGVVVSINPKKKIWYSLYSNSNSDSNSKNTGKSLPSYLAPTSYFQSHKPNSKNPAPLHD